MTNRRVLLLGVFLAVVVGGAWWWRSHRPHATPATSTVTQAAGAGSAAQPAPVANAAQAPARATVTVTDDKGPIADAIVRFAPEEGDVIAIRTSADGVARADKLAPGRWEISGSAPNHEPAALPAAQLASGADEKLALTLVAGGKALSGVVTDASGGPVAGARIDAAKLGGMARPGKAVATALTGADGKYQVTVSQGQLLVAVSSPDYAPQSRYVEVGASGATADFSLVPGGVIEGIVLDEKTRQAAPGARVEARRDRSGGGAVMLAEGGGHHAIAGADGRFRISGMRPGAYELGAHADARDTKSPTIVGIGVAEQVTDVELLVGVGPVIRGVVVDEGGAPVADAHVSAMVRGPGSEANTDAKGAFILEGLAPGSYFLTANSDVLVPGGGTSVELGDKDLDGVKINVRRGTKLVGHVEPRQICEIQFDPDGDAVAGMPIMIAPVTTAADGEFSLGPATPGKAILSARCPSGDQGKLPIEVKDAMKDLVVKVTPGASIAGRVIDGDGKPVANATVMAALSGPTQRAVIVNGLVTSGVQALTNGAGNYELRGLAPGTYRLSALDRGRPLRMRGKPVSVALAAMEAKTGVELAVDRPNGVIKGTVTGPDGKALADAWVTVHQDLGSLVEGIMNRGDDAPSGEGESRMMTIESRDEDGGGGASEFPPALTDAQGHFEIAGLPHAKYEVVAEAQQGKLRGRSSDVTPDATVAIQVKGLTTLSGTVHGASGPAKLFTVELDGATTAARTFTDGKFQLGRVDPGAYTVRVTSNEGNAEVKVQVLPDQPATVDIALAANAVVVGKLVDGTGKPLGGLPVSVFADTGGPGVQISLEGPPPTSNPDGTFRLETKAGKSMLIVMVQPRPVTQRGLMLEAGKTLDVGAVRVVAGAPPKP